MPLKLVNLFSYLTVVLRAGTLVFQSMVLGGAFFGLWTARHSSHLPGESFNRVQTSIWRLLLTSALGLAGVQALDLYVNSAVLMATTDIKFTQIIGANFFLSGSAVLGAAVTLIAVGVSSSRKVAGRWLPLLVAIILAASLMTNHAASRLTERPLLLTLSGIHEIAVGFWIGGLPFLILALYRANDPITRSYVTERFSRAAVFSVGALVISGAMMSFLYVGSWTTLGTSYGVMLIAKVMMLGSLLVLGSVNFLLVRTRSAEAMQRLRRLIEAELGIGFTIILTAVSMTSQPPAIDQIGNTVSVRQIYQRLKPRAPRLRYEYIAQAASTGSSNSSLDTRTRPTARDLDGFPLSTKKINDAIESESNHHWMGLIVLAMGIFALLARTGKARWAEYWPLLLIGIAVFIFVQADSECWPVGWKGFWACWIDPESFQHRIAALLCVGFGVFELMVRKQHRQDSPLALVFPLVCAVGGAILLTHSHRVINVREGTIIELSHVPMGILAVFAGWARWLELRLPNRYAVIPSWIWPACFVLIGTILLNYREI
jgi:putative copper resistance protein D